MAGLMKFIGNKKPAGVRLQAEAWRVLLRTLYGFTRSLVKSEVRRDAAGIFGLSVPSS